MPEPWDTPDSLTIKLYKKKSYWQHQLKSLESDGGFNILNERIIANHRKTQHYELPSFYGLFVGKSWSNHISINHIPCPLLFIL